MLLREPPAPGSRSPLDIASLVREAARAAGLSKRDVHDLVRIFTMSVGDLLDDWFEHDAVKGSIASSGVVGVWAGPRTPGTAYNLLHHALGELDGMPGVWGQVIGGMGAISQAIARSAEAAGATIRTDAEVASIDVRDGRVVGVTLASGEEILAPVVASGAHPRTTILDLAGAENFPSEIAEDMRRYRTRGGSVKINMVLSEPPRYEGVTEEQHRMLHTTGVNLCPSIDYLERAWQDCIMGRPATEPYVEAELPSAIDSSLTDDGRWVMTMFTQYGPPDEEAWEGDARERYADACVEHLARYAPNVPGRDPRTRGARAARPRADLRAAGREHLPGGAGPRPDGVHAPITGPLPLRDARARALPLRRRHPSGRRGDGRRRPQRRPPHPSRPARRSAAWPAATPSRPSRRCTSRRTELRETEVTSAHLSLPCVAHREPTERLHGFITRRSRVRIPPPLLLDPARAAIGDAAADAAYTDGNALPRDRAIEAFFAIQTSAAVALRHHLVGTSGGTELSECGPLGLERAGPALSSGARLAPNWAQQLPSC